MSAARILRTSVLILMTLAAVSCGTTTGAFVRGIGVRILRGVAGSPSDREALCAYYGQHKDEVEAVRAFARANWERVPEEYKPALVAIKEQLDACDAASAATTKRTTARALLDALKRAVALYRELKSRGVL